MKKFEVTVIRKMYDCATAIVEVEAKNDEDIDYDYVIDRAVSMDVWNQDYDTDAEYDYEVIDVEEVD